MSINLCSRKTTWWRCTRLRRHMRPVEYLHSLYPKVHITLHAGELAPGMVPPEGMKFHIRQAVEIGHAERIGHGVDAMYEDDAAGLLKGDGEKARDGGDQRQARMRAFSA